MDVQFFLGSLSFQHPKSGQPSVSQIQRSQPSMFLAACFALATISAGAETPADIHPGVRTVLSTGRTVTDEPIRYPSQVPAVITAVEITLAPGQQTGWHVHPVPLFGYILEGGAHRRLRSARRADLSQGRRARRGDERGAQRP